MFKAHFLAILVGADPSFPKYMWDKLLDQGELYLNIFHQSTLNPSILEWEYLNCPFEFASTPLGPMGCPVIIHNMSTKRKSWDQHGRDGYYIGPALKHYQCFALIKKSRQKLFL